MSRPLRIEFDGALYHVTNRGNAQQDIFLGSSDRLLFLGILAKTVERTGWLVHAYCLMTNHYHLLVETPSANLSKGMRQLNGNYTQAFNKRHDRVGHLLQGRFKAILVERDLYLRELIRYVVLNPVRAKMVKRPEDWQWSSCGATAGTSPAPEWLKVEMTLSCFSKNSNEARRLYREFLEQGITGDFLLRDEVTRQVYLGTDGFISSLQEKRKNDGEISEIPAIQRNLSTLESFEKESADRNEAMARAFLSGLFTLRQIGEHFDVHYTTVSRVVKRFCNPELRRKRQDTDAFLKKSEVSLESKLK